MQFSKARVSGCCGTAKIVYSLSSPIMKDSCTQFQNSGFAVLPAYTQAGMLYAENQYVIAVAKFGSTTLEIKCKQSNCDEKIIEFEKVLNGI